MILQSNPEFKEDLMNVEKTANGTKIDNLVDTLYKKFLGVIVFITTLSSWNNGFLYFPPYGTFRISDSHAFQLLVELHGMEKSVKLFEARNYIARTLSNSTIQGGFANTQFGKSARKRLK